MTDQEREELLAYMRNFRENMTKESAMKFLVDAGIYTEKGELAEPYENLYIPQPNEKSVVYAH
jgi:hypothetical protein